MSFLGLLKDTCTIYRLSSEFDVASSEFGEIDEVWGIVASDVKCRLDIGPVPEYLQKGGLAEIGQRALFVENSTDLRKSDRVLVDGEYFHIEDVMIVPGYSTDHHKEALAKQIDWDAVFASTDWEDEDGPDMIDLEAGRGIDATTVAQVATVKSEFDIKEFDFTFETGSMADIAAVVENERVKRVTIQITTAFDDANATLKVGHSGDNDALMASDENLPTAVGIYEVTPNYQYSADSTVRIYIDAGSSTQGAGTLYLETELND